MLQLLERPAEVLQYAMIHELDLATGGHDRNEAGNGVDDQPKTLGAETESVFGACPILKIGVRAVPRDDASPFVPDRVAAHQEPTELPVEPAKPALELEGLAGLPRTLERVEQTREIVGMDRGFPTPAQAFRCREARIVQPALIEGLRSTVRSGRPGQRRNRVDEASELVRRGIQRQCLVGTLDPRNQVLDNVGNKAAPLEPHRPNQSTRHSLPRLSAPMIRLAEGVLTTLGLVRRRIPPE